MSGLVTAQNFFVRAYLSPIILPRNEGWAGAAFWDIVGAIPDGGIVGAESASPAVSTSVGMSFTVATTDAFDMDFGRKRWVDRTTGHFRSSLPRRPSRDTTSFLVFGIQNANGAPTVQHRTFFKR